MSIPTHIWKFIESWEGGDTITDDKDDTGGLTRWGISQVNNPDVDVRNLTKEKAIEIYLDRYWFPARCHELPAFMQLPVMNCAVNCGVSTAIKTLQKTVGVETDGKFGPQTMAKVKHYFGVKKFTVAFLSWQLIYYFRIVERRSSQFKWLRGWLNRSLSAGFDNAVRYGKR